MEKASQYSVNVDSDESSDQKMKSVCKQHPDIDKRVSDSISIIDLCNSSSDSDATTTDNALLTRRKTKVSTAKKMDRDLEDSSSSDSVSDTKSVMRQTCKRVGNSKEKNAIDDSSSSDSDLEAVFRHLYKRIKRKKKVRKNKKMKKKSCLSIQRRRRTNKKYAAKTRAAWAMVRDGNEDVEDSGTFLPSTMTLMATSRRHRQNVNLPFGGVPLPEAPTALLEDEVQSKLGEIARSEDQGLQKLLYDHGFTFTLLSHQFLAARKVAGVPLNFPLHVGSSVTTATTASIQKALTGLAIPENMVAEKGVLLADVMGLCVKSVPVNVKIAHVSYHCVPQ